LLCVVSTLILSFNLIESLEGVAGLSKLYRLDISHNRLQTLSTGLTRLPALRYVDASYNLLSNIADMEYLHKHIPDMESIDLRGNPLCKMDNYRVHVLAGFTGPHTFDGAVVPARELVCIIDSSLHNHNSNQTLVID
jgi:hypothetical protein